MRLEEAPVQWLVLNDQPDLPAPDLLLEAQVDAEVQPCSLLLP